MKRLLITALTIFFFATSYAQGNAQPNRFTITGTVTGFTDNTFLYLSDLSDGSFKKIDSALILNGQFHFSGILHHEIIRLAVHTKNFDDRCPFWIDHSELTFNAEKGRFKEAVIKGSASQDKQNELRSIIADSKNKKLDYIKFIQDNPASIVSADLLSVYSSSWNKDTVAMLYREFSPAVKNTIYGKNVSDFLALNKNLKIGDKYVDFSQENIDGKTIKLSDFQGKLVLLEFWGSWCGPCREGHPELVRTYNQFKNKGFEILGVAADTNKEQFGEAIKQDGLPWQNVSDLKGDKNKAALIYGVSAYPTNFLIDKNGIIIAKNLRGEKLVEKLKEIL